VWRGAAARAAPWAQTAAPGSLLGGGCGRGRGRRGCGCACGGAGVREAITPPCGICVLRCGCHASCMLDRRSSWGAASPKPRAHAPEPAAARHASSATMVLPQPTSPCSSRSMALGPRMSASTVDSTACWSDVRSNGSTATAASTRLVSLMSCAAAAPTAHCRCAALSGGRSDGSAAAAAAAAVAAAVAALAASPAVAAAGAAAAVAAAAAAASAASASRRPSDASRCVVRQCACSSCATCSSMSSCEVCMRGHGTHTQHTHTHTQQVGAV
jgi:hypothetical protein